MLIRAVRLLALLGAFCCWTGLSSAQMMQMAMPRYPMLLNKPVQQELKITEEQLKKIQAKIKELTPEGSFGNRFEIKGDKGVQGVKGAAAAAPPEVSFGVVIKGQGGAVSPPIVLGGSSGGSFTFGGGDGERIAGLPDFKKIDEEIDKLLEQPQRDRLKQLVLQRQGLVAIAEDKVAREIGLEPEQKELVKQIMDDQRKKTQEFFQKMLADGGGFQQDQVAAQMKKLREQTEQDLAIIMTPEQKTKWDEMLGPKFDHKK